MDHFSSSNFNMDQNQNFMDLDATLAEIDEYTNRLHEISGYNQNNRNFNSSRGGMTQNNFSAMGSATGATSNFNAFAPVMGAGRDYDTHGAGHEYNTHGAGHEYITHGAGHEYNTHGAGRDFDTLGNSMDMNHNVQQLVGDQNYDYIEDYDSLFQENQNEAKTDKSEADFRSVYVGNVDYSCTVSEIEDIFSVHGVINRITIPFNKHTNKPKGFCYIEFSDIESARQSLAANDSLYKGRLLKVVPKRTNIPGISFSERAKGRGRGRARGASRASRGGRSSFRGASGRAGKFRGSTRGGRSSRFPRRAR